MAVWAQTFFIESGSVVPYLLQEYYNILVFVMLNVIMLVGSLILLFLLGHKSFWTCPSKEESVVMEILWTSVPFYWLILLGVTSLKNLYLMEGGEDHKSLFKAVGNQWYWMYEYSMSGPVKDEIDIEGEVTTVLEWFSTLTKLVEPDYSSDLNSDPMGELSFVSYMESESDLQVGDYRLLEVDNRVVCPGMVSVRVNVTSYDVIHSWAVPSLGIKVDAVPGRLNSCSFFPIEFGVFYGQCSEMCGAKHSFMPISLEVIPFGWFCDWVSEFSQ